MNNYFMLKKINASIITGLRNWVIVASVGLGVLSVPLFGQKKVTIGYQGLVNPWKHAIATEAFEKATGYNISWRKFDSGSSVLNAMASGDLQIGVAGSSPIAAGISSGVPVTLFWITEDIADAEALVVRTGAGVVSPQDLKGKRIGVPFVSTTHFHLLFALEQFNIPESSVTILNMQPNAIASAWVSGAIDAAFVWDPALAKIKQRGNVLITSGTLSSWGKATFDGTIVLKKWASQNKEFMAQFVKIVADSDAAYRKNPSAWSPNSPMVRSIVKLTGADKNTVPDTLALYNFLTLEEQASKQWLGGGAANAIRATSEFLKSQKKIPSLKKDYNTSVTTEFVQAAMKLK